MAARIIDGKAVAAKVRSEVAAGVARLKQDKGLVPGLAVVRVGDDPASLSYVTSKRKGCEETGMVSTEHHLPAVATHEEVLAVVHKLNADPSVHAILVQLPLPKQVDADAIIAAVAPEKDADGFHPVHAGNLALGRPGVRPCTPAGVMRLLEEIGFDPRGKRAVVLGRSAIVGRPMGLMLLAADATVTWCHSRTADLASEVGRADLLVAAIGRPKLVKGGWIKPGAVVIDVGTNRGADGKLVGDVEFEVAVERASAITPVPGGVGPMTVAMLLANALEAALRQS
ncbi:MAG: bifunctional methylenetetrahydrofolate dehydrogenase/methenyltetrahydrofolate cyclohydrolase FolD [Deltaproteobacteria bacterium]|nr:bifunctional methylenetetrahydrofolate dehydrogenase/methenyltetrahydrofolate cyclohydrolase FolD [Deltaproteobacteria bacterium]